MGVPIGCSVVNSADDPVAPGGEGGNDTGGSDTGGNAGGGGSATCSGTLADCDADPSTCETDTSSDDAHCGGCDEPCLTGARCEASECVCGEAPTGLLPVGDACAGGPMLFQVDDTPDALDWEWTVPEGTVIVAGEGTTVLEVTLGSQPGQICVRYAAACGPSPTTCIDVVPFVPEPGSATFNYSGSPQAWVVPICVYNIQVEAWGAQGGGAACCDPVPVQDDGGLGGLATGILPVAPGQTLEIHVGGMGVPGGAPGGFNGGGPAGQYGGSGGGATDLRLSADLGDRLIVAGGGGGGNCGCPDHGSGGGGGGLNGQAGVSLQGFTPGGGGSQTAGGAPGDSSSAGTLGLGGGLGAYHEAGGGGGLYGGGGAFAAGAGGGSCFVAPAQDGDCTAAVHAGHGQLIINW